MHTINVIIFIQTTLLLLSSKTFFVAATARYLFTFAVAIRAGPDLDKRTFIANVFLKRFTNIFSWCLLAYMFDVCTQISSAHTHFSKQETPFCAAQYDFKRKSTDLKVAISTKRDQIIIIIIIVRRTVDNFIRLCASWLALTGKNGRSGL